MTSVLTNVDRAPFGGGGDVGSGDVTAGERAPRASRPAWVDTAVLIAVAVVVVLVSLPRLRSFALHDNQGDAKHMMRVLGDALFGVRLPTAAGLVVVRDASIQRGSAGGGPLSGALRYGGASGESPQRAPGTAPLELSAVALGEVFQARPELDRRLRDTEVLGDGRLLRRHGYLFDLTRTAEGDVVLRGWPWQHGRTGLAAFVRRGDGPVLELENEDSRYSGPGRPPPADAAEVLETADAVDAAAPRER